MSIEEAKAIPINHHVKKVLDILPRALHHDIVFTFATSPATSPITSAGGLKHSFQSACAKAGIPYGRGEQNGITLHDFRRTMKTNMVRAGVSIRYNVTPSSGMRSRAWI